MSLSWKPSRLRSLLFKGSDWIFSADGEAFSLSARGYSTIKGPLHLIHAFAYRRHTAFPPTGECRFVITGFPLDKPLTGLKPDQGEEIKAYLEEHVPGSLASCGLRAQRSLNEWLGSVDRRLGATSFIADDAAKGLADTIPLPAIAGIDRWQSMFGHPSLGAARKKFPASFPSLGIAPAQYLSEKVDRHNKECIERDLKSWKNRLFKHIDLMGWIGRRAQLALLSEHEAPSWPGKSWQAVAPVEFQPDPRTWLSRCVEAHNFEHEQRQFQDKREFFDRVESNPLTKEQAQAVICMDDEVLVVAAAGSGKSSTVIAKAGYAVEGGLCAPEDILLLAFNTEAAKELRLRIGKRLAHLEGSERITAKTFHAFGLEVIGEATGKMPTTAPWLNDGQGVPFIGHLVDELCAKSEDFAEEWAMFRLVYFKGVGSWDNADETEDFDPTSPRKFGFRTLQGEIVKSKSERLIADWLFLHGVNYRYEDAYRHDTRSAKKRQYRPDFYYPEIDVYHEHWALDANGKPPEAFEGYMDGVEWKRDLHKKHQTNLFETTAHELRTGTGLRAIKRLFKDRGINLKFDPNREATGRKPESPQAVAKLLRVFQRHMKSSRQTMEQAYARVRETPGAFVPRLELFLSIYEDVARRWEEELREGGLVDFEDMLNQSAELIEQDKYPCSMKMILADEFQDSSQARMRLIQAMLVKSGAQFTAVGDDWQGIYRFAGADISLMKGFKRRFPHSARRDLSETFRCPQDLCDLTSAFISRNPAQISKGVQTHNLRPGPSIKIVALPDVESIPGRVGMQLETLHAKVLEVEDANYRLIVRLLGRYNHDSPKELLSWQKRFGDRLDLDFLTVHRAKGLEADVILLLNVVQGTLGFPSQVEDDPILQLAMPEPETFPYGEERRLFYVALTRAKRTVMIYTAAPQQSEFLVELQEEFQIPVIHVDGVPKAVCGVCAKGVVVEQVNRKTGQFFNSCSRFPKCNGKPKPVVNH